MRFAGSTPKEVCYLARGTRIRDVVTAKFDEPTWPTWWHDPDTHAIDQLKIERSVQLRDVESPQTPLRLSKSDLDQTVEQTMRTISVAVLGLLGLVVSISGCGAGPTTEEVPALSAEMSGASADAPGSSLKDDLVGTWGLSSVELRDAAGLLLPPPEAPGFGSPGAIGLLICDTAGHIGLAIMQQNRPKYEQPTPEEAMADLEGYTAFFGTYTVNETDGLVTAHIQGSRDPRLTGTEQTRAVEVLGDRLTVEVPLSASGVQPTLVWERLPEIAELTPTHRRVIGFWKHVPNEGDTVDDPLLRPGFIIYTSTGRMMVHLMSPGRYAYAVGGPTPEEAQAAVSSYTSYFGPFSVDEAGSYFVHHRVGHTLDLTDRPQSERRTGLDTDGQRFYEFVDNRMVLRFLSTAGVKPPPSSGEAEWGGMITWERMSPGPG